MTKKKIRIVTHYGRFHADDVFGVATLFLLLGEKNCNLFRTRDPEIINSGDYVLDVGDVYDPSKKRFDHHQKEGAGERENGIPYAAFGLVWKHFGEKICESKEVARVLDEKIAQPLDAIDNGVDITKPIYEGVFEYGVGTAFGAMRPSWKEIWEGKGDIDSSFLEAVHMAKRILEREIVLTRDILEGIRYVEQAYEDAEDRRLIVLPKEPAIDREAINSVLGKYKDPLYQVKYRPTEDSWQVVAVRDDLHSYKNRKDLPKEWAGKRDDELAKVTGVADAYFCHRKPFMALAKSKEGAIKLANLALNA